MRHFAPAALVALVLFVTSPLRAEMIDFEGFAHGQVVDDQFAFSNGLVITTENFNRDFAELDDGVGFDPDIGIAFDTHRIFTDDPDLEGPPNRPWRAGNLSPDTDLGKVLIIQANDTGCADGRCNRPDDEPGRDAGRFVLELDTPMAGIGLDLVDVEEIPLEVGRLTLMLGDVLVGSVSFDEFACQITSRFCIPGVEFGDGSANRIPTIFASDFGGVAFDQVSITLGGSGGVDNILLSPVPEPGTAALVALGVAALAAVRRARNENAPVLARPRVLLR